MTTRPTAGSAFEEAAAQLRTVRDFVRWGASRCNEAGLTFGHGTDNAVDEALALVASALHLDLPLPGELWEARLTAAEAHRVTALIRRRIGERLPAAYLTHRAWFAGLEFYVDARVLVPRSPLAELIEQGFEPWLAPERVRSVLDLCTGSGCIAVACAQAFPAASVDASDLSEEALAVARINIARHGLGSRVHALRADLFAGLGERRYDLIVSNPPYVDAEDMAALAPEFLHEPRIGLEAGADGLAFARRILAGAPEHLNPGGILVVEVGNSEAALSERFPEVPFLWLEFERGGHGVFLLTADQLAAHRAEFAA